MQKSSVVADSIGTKTATTGKLNSGMSNMKIELVYLVSFIPYLWFSVSIFYEKTLKIRGWGNAAAVLNLIVFIGCLFLLSVIKPSTTGHLRPGWYGDSFFYIVMSDIGFGILVLFSSYMLRWRFNGRVPWRKF